MEPAGPECDENNFSLMLGGPLYQLYRRTRICGNALELLHRRIVAFSLFAWLPLLLLTASYGTVAESVAVPFVLDIEVHVRFLVALPLLIWAELFVHDRLKIVVVQFIEQRIVAGEELQKFRAAIATTMKWRNSITAEIALLVFVYTVGLAFWTTRVALETPTWYASPEGTGLNMTPAGYWYMLVSVPLFQLFLLRWYYRLFLWFRFLFQVSRMRLNLHPIHPDRTGGIGFLGGSNRAFAPVLLAQGVMTAGLMASQIFHMGRGLLDFRVTIAGFIAFFVLTMLAPLVVFVPVLAEAKRKGLRKLNRLATRYVSAFEDKWVQESIPEADLLGSADIQSMADLGNSLSFVQGMRFLPFGLRDVARFSLLAAAPFLPLTLTAFSLDELLNRLLAVLF